MKTYICKEDLICAVNMRIENRSCPPLLASNEVFDIIDKIPCLLAEDIPIAKKKRGFEAVDGQHRRHCTVEPKLPERSTKGSAGYDFYTPVDITIQPGEIVRVMTDVCAYMQEDEVLMLYPRSSMGKQGIRLANGTGVVDSDYYHNENNGGNIGIMLHNTSNATWFAKAGDRIMQGIFVKYLVADNGNCENVRDGGFGSTGR